MSLRIQQTEFTSEQIGEAFARLDIWLKERGLTPTKYFPESLGTINDFMLMYEGYSDEQDQTVLAFKHADSRNYLIINKNPKSFNK